MIEAHDKDGHDREKGNDYGEDDDDEEGKYDWLGHDGSGPRSTLGFSASRSHRLLRLLLK